VGVLTTIDAELHGIGFDAESCLSIYRNVNVGQILEGKVSNPNADQLKSQLPA
jgi:hypothetical protein